MLSVTRQSLYADTRRFLWVKTSRRQAAVYLSSHVLKRPVTTQICDRVTLRETTCVFAPTAAQQQIRGVQASQRRPASYCGRALYERGIT